MDPDPLHETDPDTDPGSKKLREIHIEINQNYKIAYHIREKKSLFHTMYNIQCVLLFMYIHILYMNNKLINNKHKNIDLRYYTFD